MLNLYSATIKEMSNYEKNRPFAIKNIIVTSYRLVLIFFFLENLYLTFEFKNHPLNGTKCSKMRCRRFELDTVPGTTGSSVEFNL
jgi:hypothetical protein